MNVNHGAADADGTPTTMATIDATSAPTTPMAPRRSQWLGAMRSAVSMCLPCNSRIGFTFFLIYSSHVLENGPPGGGKDFRLRLIGIDLDHTMQ